MPQTFLALAAVLCFTFLALSRQQSDQDVVRRAIAAEVDLAAVDVAQALMTRVERSAFDEDDTARSGVRTQPSAFPLGPDAGEDSPVDYDDVDDWMGYSGAETATVGAGTLSFQTFAHVRYVDDDDISQPSASATLTKEVTIVVVELRGSTDRPPARAFLRRVVTPAGIASATPVTE